MPQYQLVNYCRSLFRGRRIECAFSHENSLPKYTLKHITLPKGINLNWGLSINFMGNQNREIKVILI